MVCFTQILERERAEREMVGLMGGRTIVFPGITQHPRGYVAASRSDTATVPTTIYIYIYEREGDVGKMFGFHQVQGLGFRVRQSCLGCGLAKCRPTICRYVCIYVCEARQNGRFSAFTFQGSNWSLRLHYGQMRTHAVHEARQNGQFLSGIKELWVSFNHMEAHYGYMNLMKKGVFSDSGSLLALVSSRVIKIKHLSQRQHKLLLSDRGQTQFIQATNVLLCGLSYVFSFSWLGPISYIIICLW